MDEVLDGKFWEVLGEVLGSGSFGKFWGKFWGQIAQPPSEMLSILGDEGVYETVPVTSRLDGVKKLTTARGYF
jgi:hypothetical protein